MNHLKLVVVNDPDRRDEYRPVDILIDGERLIDVLTRIETPYAIAEGSPELAGHYHSLSIKTTFPPSRHFLGEPKPILAHDAKTAILVCACGCEGCWDFVCRIDFPRTQSLGRTSSKFIEIGTILILGH
ncbi:hypothetical protein [Planctomicrobium piriforme]|uniref:hypothetical protein n=1 Tax=Planctomicrobium piriforme TaxID=1576369 RepID=UPI000B806AD6|nr:hypothetical protein [Planctomicrobium piriforme]